MPTEYLDCFVCRLSKMNPATRSFQNFRHSDSDPTSLCADRVESVFRDRNGTLWVGTRAGLDAMDNASGTFQHFKTKEGDENSLSSNDVRSIYQDQDGVLWFGGDGLTSYDGNAKKWRRYKVDAADTNALLEGFVLAILDAEQGKLWVNDARGGLCKLDKASGVFTRLHKKLGLPINTAGMVRDAKSVLWLTGESSGAWSYNPANGEVHNYGKGFGLPSMDAADRSIYRTADGELWVGTNKGLAHFYPDSLERNPYKPPVVINALRHCSDGVFVERFLGTEDY